MAPPRFTCVTRTQGNNQALKDGRVRVRGAELDFVEVPVLVQAFRRMVRGLEFDICEMAITTYLCAREHGIRFTGLPVFLVRGFHHGAISCNTAVGIEHPKDLEGRRVGVNRGYTVTTGVWARAVLAQEYGVDLDKVTWVLSGDEHVARYQPPGNVVPVAPGGDLAELLAAGELAATIGVEETGPDIAPLIPDAEQAGLASLRRNGYYPINHLIVVRDEVLDRYPELPGALVDAFAESKARYLDQLTAGAIKRPTAADRTYGLVQEVTGADPLPYGVEPNREVLEALGRHAVDQHILAAQPDIDALFAVSP